MQPRPGRSNRKANSSYKRPELLDLSGFASPCVFGGLDNENSPRSGSFRGLVKNPAAPPVLTLTFGLSPPDPCRQPAMRTGLLLINLGTPDAPTTTAVRRYLREFLTDPRVVEIPRAVWWFILNFFILPFRPKQSARRYAQVWTPDGSPLRMHTEKQARMLRGYLGERIKAPLVVDYAMRYGTPSVPAVLTKLKQQGCDRILVVPL